MPEPAIMTAVSVMSLSFCDSAADSVNRRLVRSAQKRPMPDQRAGLVVEEVLVFDIKPRGGDCHRAVEVNGQLWKLPAP